MRYRSWGTWASDPKTCHQVPGVHVFVDAGQGNKLKERADGTVDITFDEVLHQQEVGNAS